MEEEFDPLSNVESFPTTSIPEDLLEGFGGVGMDMRMVMGMNVGTSAQPAAANTVHTTAIADPLEYELQAQLQQQQQQESLQGVSQADQTADQVLESLKTNVQKSCQQVGLTAKPTQSSRLHPYGPLNIYEQKNQFIESLSKLRWLLQQSKIWSASGERDVLVNRYLNLLKDKKSLDTLLNEQLLKCIDQCQQAAQQHMEFQQTKDGPSTTTSNTKSYHPNILQRLKTIAENLDLQYFEDSHSSGDLETLEDIISGTTSTKPNITVSIGSQNFLIDVTISKSDYEVQGAKIEFTGEQSRSQFHTELYESLRKKFDDFERKLRVLAEQDALYRTYPSFDLKKLLKNMESDFLNLYNFERKSHSDLDILKTFNGIPKLCCEGLILYFYLPQEFVVTYSQEKDITQNATSLFVSIEQSDLTHPNNLPSTSQLTFSKNGVEFAPPNENGTAIPFQFILHFNEPIPMSSVTLKRLLGLHASNLLHVNKISTSNSNSLQHILANTTDDPIISGKHVDNSYFRFMYPLPFLFLGINRSCHLSYCDLRYTGPLTEVVTVARLPFTHLRQVGPLLQILRQQLVFNELFLSCFKKSEELLPNSTTKRTMEVVCDPPNSLSVTFLHPSANAILCLEIKVELNGILSAVLHVPPQFTPPCSNGYATDIINACHSIPLTLVYIQRSFAHKQNS